MRMTLLHNMDDIGCGKSTQHGEIKKNEDEKTKCSRLNINLHKQD